MRTIIEWHEEWLDDVTCRIQVIGGWIVYRYSDTGIANMFIKDKDHEWQIKKPVDQIPPAVVYQEFGSPTL